MRLYHRSVHAAAIRQHGFTDGTGGPVSLIWPHRDGLIWPHLRHAGCLL